MADLNKLIDVRFISDSTKIPTLITGTASGLSIKLLTPNSAIMLITKNARGAFTNADTMNLIVADYKANNFSRYNFKMLTAFAGQLREYLTFIASQSGANNISAAYIGELKDLATNNGLLDGPFGGFNSNPTIEGDTN